MEKGMKASIAKFTVFTIVCLMLFLVLWNTMTRQVSSGAHSFTAMFTNVSGLRTGDDVRVAGVRVGRVDSIGVENGEAKVKFRLEHDQPIYSNTVASIRYQNLLGQRYVALLPGAGDAQQLRPGSVIDLSHTQGGFDLTSLLNGLAPIFSTLDPSDVNKFASNIVAVFQGEGGTIDSLLQQTATFTNGLADKDQVIGDVLQNLNPVLQNMVAHSSDFDATVAALKGLMTGLAADRANLGNAIDSTNLLTQATASLTSLLKPNVEADIASLKNFANLTATKQNSLNTLLQALPGAAGRLAQLGEYGSFLNVYLCNLQVAIGSAVVNSATAANGYSAVCK